VNHTYLVECYWPGVTESALNDAGQRAGAAARQLRAAGHQVRFLGSLLVPGDEVAFCRFISDSLADVEQASTTAELPFSRVLDCVELPANDGDV
jgi:hypothetical protein